jgi:hypothetical protein
VARLRAHGIEAVLPDGFEGRIFVRPQSPDMASYPVAHFATFPLPANVADFGGGAVTLMGPNDIFAVLFEYGPESVGKALFARQGMQRSLTPRDFRPTLLRRGLGGQSGSHARRGVLVPQVNTLLTALTVNPQPVVATPGAAPWN